jgi:riboflavin kinase/FMN adenylyltransferase
MRHYWSLENIFLEDSWLTIGSFDGVHLGHQYLIRSLASTAHTAGAPAVALSFYPHPAVVLGKRKDPFYLTSPEEKAEIMGALGLDHLINHPFNRQIASTSARDFLNYLHQHLNFRQLWVGPDFALGRGREGDIPYLRQLGGQIGFDLHVIDPILNGGEVISSSRIRQAIMDGDLSMANLWLGRPFRISGEVIHGDGRGRDLGVPTANLAVWDDHAIPKPGVYVCRAYQSNNIWGAVTNVGYRPTFENQPEKPRIEAYLLDFNQDLYGQRLQLDFLHRLRDEVRFPNVPALIDQMHMDIEQSRVFLAQYATMSKMPGTQINSH